MKILNAICFIANRRTRKYHIRNTPASIKKFQSFCEKVQVETINYYDSESRKFLYQVLLNKNSPSIKDRE